VNLSDWSPSQPADIIDMADQGSLQFLLDRYGGSKPDVLKTILAQVFTAGARMTVIEYRYLDPHYRDEHSNFYSKTFRRYPSVAHRLHFFTDPPPEALASEHEPVTFSGLNYLGFVVIRPVPAAPVGRVALRPPADLEPVLEGCMVTERANLFGDELLVRCVPFMAQDGQLGVCAHATLWMVSQQHHLRTGSPTYLPSYIADAAPDEIGFGRPIPSVGLTIFQLSAAATRLNLPAFAYALDALPPSESLFRIVCRYLNSGLPVIVAGCGHAWVLVGYRTAMSPGGADRIEFIRHDDEVGPYQVVPNPNLDDYAPWEYIVVPLPPHVFVLGEHAEAIGEEYIKDYLRRSTDGQAATVLNDLDTPESGWTFRTTLIASNEFKAGLGSRGVPPILAALYRRSQLSRLVWVVELTQRDERRAGRPSVVAEAVIDSTDHLRDLRPLLWRIPGRFYSWIPDEDREYFQDLPPIPLLQSLAGDH
jgi:hypothetical protein